MSRTEDGFRQALGGYVLGLIDLGCVVTGTNKAHMARRIGVHPNLFSQWGKKQPLSPRFERRLREILIEGCQALRDRLDDLTPTDARHLQYQIQKQLVLLDLSYVQVMGEYTASRTACLDEEAAWRHDIGGQAMTPTLTAAMAQPAPAGSRAVNWPLLRQRNRQLRALVAPEAASQVTKNLGNLLEFVEEWYAIEPGEPLEARSGIGRRLPGRPRKTTV
jgi:DNA-binding transcriptional regulator YdaS (Cro superfamily)